MVAESAPAPVLLDPQVKADEEVYVDLLVRASLLLVSKDFPPEIQCHGTEMSQHLLKFRCDELSSADLLHLKVELVGSRNEDHTLSKTTNRSEQDKHRTSLILLSANNNMRSLAAEETEIVNAPRRQMYILESDGSSHSSSSNESGTRPDTSNRRSSESSNETNISCVRSSGLYFDAQVEYEKRESEVQRILLSDICDYSKDDGDSKDKDDFGSRITVSKRIVDIVHPRMLGFDGKAYSHQVKGCLLLAEHNILCQAFVVISSFRKAEYNGVAHCLLNALNIIWTQQEWESTFFDSGLGLSCLFSDGKFLKIAHSFVKSCETELKINIEERFTERDSNDTYSVSLLRLFLPLILQLLRCIHALWKDRIACYLFEEIERAKTLMDGEEEFEHNETRILLEEIRLSGYNIIGLSMSLEGAFSEILDSSSLSSAFVDLEYMEFRHLRELIHRVFHPLVKSCPCELWKEWMLNLVRPLLKHCDDVLYSAWFSLMHRCKGRAEVAYYFGKLFGSVENIEKSKHTILLEFTREVSRLFGSLCSPELNNGLFHGYFEDAINNKMIAFQDLESISSKSIIGYLFAHDCFGSLRMSLFGYWVDEAAAREAIPFCRALVLLAGVTKDERLRLFVLDELLPSLIKRLDDELSCAIRHLNFKLNSSDDVNKNLTSLCQESYNYLYINVVAPSQDLVVEDKDRDNAADYFTCWFTKQKNGFRVKTLRAPPEEFNGWKVEWKWEFEDEFRRYLPVYIDMLKEVDAIDDSSEQHHSKWEYLQKLKPQFRSKYTINSIEHPHFTPISYMRRRKFHSTTQVSNDICMSAALRKLITLKPYIKGSDSSYSVINRLEQTFEISSGTFDTDDVEESVQVLLDSILSLWEPQFHPLIREGHMDLLFWIIDQITKAKEFEHFQPLAPDPEDFPPHLKHYAMLYIVTKLKTPVCAMAKVQLNEHENYDNYLASGELDSYIYESLSLEDDFSEKDVSCAVPHQFSVLDRDLIKLSLKRRARIVQIHHEVCTYLDCLRGILADESAEGRLKDLIRELEVVGFFDVDNDRVNWEKKHFTELIHKFRDEVFTGHSLPRHYVIRGIIDYRTILLWKDSRWRAFEQEVDEPCNRLIAYLPQFWRDTRHYMRGVYDDVREPLEKIFV